MNGQAHPPNGGFNGFMPSHVSPYDFPASQPSYPYPSQSADGFPPGMHQIHQHQQGMRGMHDLAGSPAQHALDGAHAFQHAVDAQGHNQGGMGIGAPFAPPAQAGPSHQQPHQHLGMPAFSPGMGNGHGHGLGGEPSALGMPNGAGAAAGAMDSNMMAMAQAAWQKTVWQNMMAAAAFAMSASGPGGPVGPVPGPPSHGVAPLVRSDAMDHQLARVLYAARAERRRFRSVLEELAAHMHIDAGALKDYYLENVYHFEKLAASFDTRPMMRNPQFAPPPAPLHIPHEPQYPPRSKRTGPLVSASAPAPRAPAPAARKPLAARQNSSASAASSRRAPPPSQSPLSPPSDVPPSQLPTSAGAGTSASARTRSAKPALTRKPLKRKRNAPSSSEGSGSSAADSDSDADGDSDSSEEVTARPTKRTPFISSTRGFAPASPRGPKLPLLQANIAIPEPPSRSPAPPARASMAPAKAGNHYTDEDKTYFIDFIGYELRKDPTLTKQDLITMIAKKAPHHSRESWGRHWYQRHDIADNILLRAALKVEEESDDARIKREKAKKQRTRASTSGAGPSAKPARHNGPYESPSEDEDVEEEADAEGDSDVEEPGRHGEAYTEGDLRLVAEYIASMGAAQWREMAYTQRWDGMNERNDQRSAKAWANYYTKRKEDIHTMAQKFRARQKQKGKGKGTSQSPAKESAKTES